MRVSGAPQRIGGCHRGATGRLSAHAVGSHARAERAIEREPRRCPAPGRHPRNEWPDREYPNATRARSCPSRKATNFCLTFALLVLI
jgi:hypothetical protein